MLAIVSAPTNLGLRPPEPGGVPGVHKAPEALREVGLYAALEDRGAVDAGVVLPGRYVDDDATRSPDRLRNQDAIVDHARRLGRRIRSVLDQGRTPLVLGGDCSVLVGAALGLAGLDRGLVHVDGHTDFRHPGLAEPCASLAGEDLAAAVGRHWPSIADIDGCGPYVDPARAVHLGCRAADPEASDASTVIGMLVRGPDLVALGPARTAREAVQVARPGYWLQVDVDVIDPEWMPAVDSPDPGGLRPEQLVELLRGLAPSAAGASVTILDPDLDPDGRCARLVRDVVVEGLGELGSRSG